MTNPTSARRVWLRAALILGSATGARAQGKDLVVFDIVRDAKCADCGKELRAHDFLFMEGERPLCLTCADLDHLVYLHRGNTALTRRARRHSTLSAVVLRFSSARKRYERQGVLVEEAALEHAEQQCWPMLINALPSAKERRFTARNRIRCSRREWRNRFGRCFPAALPRKRG